MHIHKRDHTHTCTGADRGRQIDNVNNTLTAVPGCRSSNSAQFLSSSSCLFICCLVTLLSLSPCSTELLSTSRKRVFWSDWEMKRTSSFAASCWLLLKKTCSKYLASSFLKSPFCKAAWLNNSRSMWASNSSHLALNRGSWWATAVSEGCWQLPILPGQKGTILFTHCKCLLLPTQIMIHTVDRIKLSSR